MTLTITPGLVKLKDLEDIWKNNRQVIVDRSFMERVQEGANVVQNAAEGHLPVYGINTGFGKLANVLVSQEDSEKLQRNLILSHCCGVGEMLDISSTRLMMVLKLISLGRGASGVRWRIINHIEEMLSRDIIPVVPVQGSVGASGDLAPLAHMTAAMIGEGEVYSSGNRMGAADALSEKGIDTLKLVAKEGLALINGTQFSTACALVGLFEGLNNAFSGIVSSALSTDAIMGSTDPLRSEIHELRGHKGQIQVANNMEKILEG